MSTRLRLSSCLTNCQVQDSDAQVKPCSMGFMMTRQVRGCSWRKNSLVLLRCPQTKECPDFFKSSPQRSMACTPAINSSAAIAFLFRTLFNALCIDSSSQDGLLDAMKQNWLKLWASLLLYSLRGKNKLCTFRDLQDGKVHNSMYPSADTRPIVVHSLQEQKHPGLHHTTDTHQMHAFMETRRRKSRKQGRRFDKWNVGKDCRDEQCKEYRKKNPAKSMRKNHAQCCQWSWENDGCHERRSSKTVPCTAEVMAVMKDCPMNCWSAGCHQNASSKTLSPAKRSQQILKPAKFNNPAKVRKWHKKTVKPRKSWTQQNLNPANLCPANIEPSKGESSKS